MIYIGIDPGASGGMAAIYPDGKPLSVTKMPDTPRDILEWITGIALMVPGPSFAYIEQVSGYIGGEGHPGSGMFKFGTSYGMLLMALTAGKVPYREVVPRVWQRTVGVPVRGKGESKHAYKTRLKTRAQAIFPSESVTLKTADALLIAEYGRIIRGGARDSV